MQQIWLKQGSLWPKLQATINIQRSGNLTGCSVSFRRRKQDETAYTVYQCTVDDAAAGTIEYQWQPGDTDVAGTWWLEFWIVVPNVGNMIVPDDASVSLTITPNIS